MKKLLILRHAKSSWDDPALADHDRPLNERGERDAPRMGKLIKDQDIVPDMIICSTAKRARETAKLVAEHCGYKGKISKSSELYGEGFNAYFETLKAIGSDPKTVMVVGHNPDIQEFTAQVIGREERMPTAALAYAEIGIKTWKDFSPKTPGKCVSLWRPKEL